MYHFLEELLEYIGTEIRFCFSKIIGKNRSKASLKGDPDKSYPTDHPSRKGDPVQSWISKIVGFAVLALVTLAAVKYLTN